MKIIWQIEPTDIAWVKSFFKQHKDHWLVRERIEINCCKTKSPLTRAIVWEKMTCCLLTTQQKSGPKSSISRFYKVKPFPLCLKACSQQTDIAKFATRVLSRFGGIRRSTVIGHELASNYLTLSQGGSEQLLERLEAIRVSASPQSEREAARYIAETLKGFGPKQSRNLLQWLGLSQAEIPLDSRLTKWLNEFGFPIKLNAASLQDHDYYDFVLDGFQQLCRACKIVPCVLDAAIFSSFDRV